MRSPTTEGLQMRHIRPTAYLDHWAFRKFSTDPALSSRLVKVLRARSGTLALSWLNLGEYAKVSVVASRQAAEKFVDDVLPSIFCIQVDLAAVDKREKAAARRRRPSRDACGRDRIAHGQGDVRATSRRFPQDDPRKAGRGRSRAAGTPQRDLPGRRHLPQGSRAEHA